MDITNFPQKDQENFRKLIEKAHEDREFKNQLVADPKGTIEKLAGKEFDLQGFKLVVTDQSDPSTVYVNIPVNENAEDLELTEEQLELVSGGKDCWITVSITIRF